MSLANKSFKNNLTGEVVTVIDSFESIAILENREKINVGTLMNPALYTEEIDPMSFFNNQGAYNILAEKIKNIPQDQIVDDIDGVDVSTNVDRIDVVRQEDDSIISVTTEEDEKAALAAKYGIATNTNSTLKQNEAFVKILGDDADLPQVVQPQIIEPAEVIQRVEVNREEVVEYSRTYVQPVEVEDPILKMFKGVKRIVDLNINLDIKNKIPRLDFIEMMEDSYETSIIDFLADEFTNEILKNPKQIRDMIKSKINILVYGEDKKEIEIVEEPKVEEPKNEVKKERKPRAPRVKKEIVK